MLKASHGRQSRSATMPRAPADMKVAPVSAVFLATVRLPATKHPHPSKAVVPNLARLQHEPLAMNVNVADLGHFVCSASPVAVDGSRLGGFG